MSKYLELVEGSFTAEHEQKAQEWPYVAYSVQDGKCLFSIVPSEDGTMYTVYRVVSKDISNCTYNMVDLGLPSGLKWADRNVGASSPEDYGSYFQWGDTDAYTYDGAGEVTAAKLAEMLNPILSPELGMEITADNVGMILEQMGMTSTDLTPAGLGGVLGEEFNWDSYFDTADGGSTFNKYNNNGGLTILESIDDTATVHMGVQYRTPTMDEIQELVNNTTQTFIDLDGNEYSKDIAQNVTIEQGKLKGVKFTGLNGNSIFIPAAGNCEESVLSDIGSIGIIWSSSLYTDDLAVILGFLFGGLVEESGHIERYIGLPVRGVTL